MATMAGSGKIVRNFFRGETFWFPSIETPSLSFFAKISFISFLPQPSEAAAAAAIAKALNSKSNNTRASVIFLCSNNLSKNFTFGIWGFVITPYRDLGRGGGLKKVLGERIQVCCLAGKNCLWIVRCCGTPQKLRLFIASHFSCHEWELQVVVGQN